MIAAFNCGPSEYEEACRQIEAGTAVDDLDPDLRETFFDVEVAKLKSGATLHPALRAPEKPVAALPSPNVVSLADWRAKRPRSL